MVLLAGSWLIYSGFGAYYLRHELRHEFAGMTILGDHKGRPYRAWATVGVDVMPDVMRTGSVKCKAKSAKLWNPAYGRAVYKIQNTGDRIK